MNLTRAFLISLLSWAVFPAGAAPATVESIENQTFTIPAPPGFGDPSGVSERLLGQSEALTPPGNRRTALFISEAGFKRAAAQQDPPMNRYFLAQAMREFEAHSITPAMFSEIRVFLSKKQSTLLADARLKSQEQIDTAVASLARKYKDPSFSPEAGESMPLGIFQDSASSIGLADLVRYSDVVDGQSEVRLVVVTTNATLVRGKVLLL